MNKHLYCLPLLIMSFMVVAKVPKDSQYHHELTNFHYKEYFAHETCYEYAFDNINPYYDILQRDFIGNVFVQLKKRNYPNQQLLLKKITERCDSEQRVLPYVLIKKHPREDYLNYNHAISQIDEIVAKIICLANKSRKCDETITNNELDLVIRSKENYIHEQVQYAKSRRYDNYLSERIAKHIKTEHTGLAKSIYKDAQLLYQCTIGKDCSATSLYMIQKCTYHQEFCGLDVETYLQKYKTTPSQYKDIKKALEFLINY